MIGTSALLLAPSTPPTATCLSTRQVSRDNTKSSVGEEKGVIN